MVEANSSLAERVVPALHKFVSLANTMLHNGEGLEDWTRTRWEDFVITLQWCVDRLNPLLVVQRVLRSTTVSSK